MYSGRCIILFLFILVRAENFFLENQCTYTLEHKCYVNVNNNTIKYSPSAINYCTAEDVPENDDIHFGVKRDELNRGNLIDSLKVEFALPKKECGLEIALLVNPLIKNEKECEEFKFEKVSDINLNIHTIERVCILRNSNQLEKYNDNLTESSCEDVIGLWFQHIFTGCYAIRFHIGSRKHVIRGHKFLNTTYQRTEVTEPHFICKYDTYFNLDQRHEISNFTLDISLPIHTGLLLEVGLISPQNKNTGKGCIWNKEPLRLRHLINLKVTNIEDILEDYCNVKLTQSGSGEYMKIVQCNFQVPTQTADYCFLFSLVDERCYENTIWNPPRAIPTMPCTWVKHCVNASLHNKNSEIIKSDKLGANLLLPIIAIVLILSAIIGTLGFWYLCIRKKEAAYINPQHDDFLNSACFESTDLSIIDNNDSEKEIDHDNLSCDDIVLLYTKNSMSFMGLMKDFREILAKMCSCSVYDWYDEAECNNVAKVGPVPWFTKLLNSKCRAIWIDTPTTRSIVISKEYDSDLNKLNKYYGINDFRDMAFPVVLELAKRNTHNAKQYRRHFVVRFEGLESTANVNDPFLDLSPHARYRMPQHLKQLCLDLSMEKSIISNYQLKIEENLLQQRLKLVKMESII